MISRRILVPFFTVAALLGTFVWSERATSRSAAHERITVTYWEKWTGFEGEAMRAVVDAFNESQDRIYVKMLTISRVHDKTMLATSGGNPPDVAGLFDWNVAQFVDADAVYSLETFMANAGIDEDYYIPGYWEIVTIEGTPYAAPSAPSSTLLHVNADHMPERYKDPANFPKTLEEFDALIDEVSIKRPDGSIERAGFLPAEPGWWKWGFGHLFGGELWTGGTDLAIDSEENIRAFEWVQSFSERFGAAESQSFRTGFGNFSSPQNAFFDGKVSMVLQGVWMANFIQQFAPDLNWYPVPMPHPADRPDLANTTYLGLDVLVIPKGAAHPEEAWEFIEFVQSQEGMELLCLGQAKNSPLKNVSDEFYANHRNPYIRMFDEQARGPNAVIAPKLGIWPEMQAELGSAFDEINLMSATPREALQRAQQRLQPRLVEHIRRQELRRQAD